MKRTLSRAVAVMPAVMLAVGLAAGCAGKPGPTDLGYRDVPADRIAVDVFKADKLSRLEEAQQRTRAECMAARGYPQLVDAGLPDSRIAFITLNVTAPGFATRTEADAGRSGFGDDEPAQAPHVLSFDPTFDRAFERCTGEASRKLGPEFARVRGQLYDIVNAISVRIAEVSTSQPAVASFDAIAAPLMDCLDRKGLHRAEGPRSLGAYSIGEPKGQLSGVDPAPPKRVPGTVEILPAVPERTYLPAPGEAETAVAASQCARETGYADKYVAARLTVTRQVLAAQYERLTPLTRRIDELAGRSA